MKRREMEHRKVLTHTILKRSQADVAKVYLTRYRKISQFFWNYLAFKEI